MQCSKLASAAVSSLKPVCVCVQLVQLTEVPPASEAVVTAVHTKAWLSELQELVRTQAPFIIEEDDEDDEVTYITSTSYQDALQVLPEEWEGLHVRSELQTHILSPHAACLRHDGPASVRKVDPVGSQGWS